MRSNEFITFGCRLNAYETEVMRGHAAAAGLENVVVVNTCAVTQEAVRQARQSIRKARRAHPDARIVITGCAAQVRPQDFAAMGQVDVVLGNREKLDPERFAAGAGDPAAARVQVGDIMVAALEPRNTINGLTGRTRAFVQIQNGCNHRCTFCIIPFGRGNSRSNEPVKVVEQIARLVENGTREVVLTGVDITAYGSDLDGDTWNLGALVRTILRDVPALARLRLSSIDSIEVDDDLMRAIAEEDRLMPHLHLSLQSGDDMILKRMKRRHGRAHSIAFCKDVRAVRPDIVFGADLIAGFPTETEKMFTNTCDLVRQCGLTRLHVFPYSARPGTPAACMPQVDGGTIKRRAKRLRALGDDALSAHLAAATGTVRTVLMETETIGRTAQFTPVAFGAKQAPGTLIEAAMTGHDGTRLQGSPRS